MEIIVAKSAGFCFGVKKAVDTVYHETKKQDKLYTYGPIIHNEEVVSDLENKGVKVVENIYDLENGNGTVVIRSHGAKKSVYDAIKDKGYNIVDATCPFVKKIHNLVEEESKKGSIVVIVGNEKHPEVEGIRGWVRGESYVVENNEDIEKLDFSKDKKIFIVSQTTFNPSKFNNLVENIAKKGYDYNVVNTICNATHTRQAEAKEIAKNVDAMIVIGGKKSSNTQKLFEICKSECKNTFFIQTVNDMDFNEIKKFSKIGITAGASTPKKIIEEVHTECQK